MILSYVEKKITLKKLWEAVTNDWMCLDMANPLSWQSGKFCDEPYVCQLSGVLARAVLDKPNGDGWLQFWLDQIVRLNRSIWNIPLKINFHSHAWEF